MDYLDVSPIGSIVIIPRSTVKLSSGVNVLTKHQLRVVGERDAVADFVNRIGGPFPDAGLWLVPDEADSPLLYEEFAVDFGAAVPLGTLSGGAQIVAALDEEDALLRGLRVRQWGVEEIPRGYVMRLWGSGAGAGAVIGFSSRDSGTLVPFVRRVTTTYPSLALRALWVHWPTSVARDAGAFFAASGTHVTCPRARDVEQFARSFGWLGDHGFNENFFYRSPGSEKMFSTKTS
jgi:hypothetical protein